jgi:hypothetical protein
MNDSCFVPEIQNLLRALDDGILDAELMICMQTL